MQSTGIIRNVDDLGRIVLPIELRRVLGINEGDPLEIYEDGKHIMLKPYRGHACFFCGDAGTQLVHFKHHLICSNCLTEIHPAKATETEPILLDEPRKREKQSAMLDRLQLFKMTFPDANQREIGELLGVSPGRVSQLYKELKQRTIR